MDSLIHCIGISTTSSTSFKVFSITQSTSFQKITAIQFSDLQAYSHKETEFSVNSAAIISNHISRASFIASIVKSNCLSQTIFSAQSEVLQTFELSSGDGVYHVIRTSHHNESAVRIIFQTLYAERIFSSITIL
jgi:hypothetical protein